MKIKYKMIWAIGYILRPYLFKKYNIAIKLDAETGWYDEFSNGELVGGAGTYDMAVKSCIAKCMSQYNWVQKALG